jgi:molybdopterin molybdotransferase
MLIPIEEAHALIEKSFAKSSNVKSVKVWEALGKVVATDLVSPTDVPERPLSAMDGYAVRASDLEKFPKLRVVGKSFPSSDTAQELKEGEAIYVTTGSPVPLGADAVVRVEAVRLEGDFVTTSVRPKPGQDIRPQGEDFRRGETLVKAGTLLNERQLALLLRAGVEEVSVLDVKSCVFATGDEISPFYRSEPGRIRDSIAPTILAYLNRFGKAEYLGVVRDDQREVESAISKAANECDLIVSIGGSSMGERDYVKKAVSKLGELLFEGVNVNVIKRCGVGKVGDKPFVALPGQVVSAVTSFHEFGLHVIEKFTGLPIRRTRKVALGNEVSVKHSMDSTYLVKVEDGRATTLRWGVGLYSELAKADGYTILKRGVTYKQGDLIDVSFFL